MTEFLWLDSSEICLFEHWNRYNYQMLQHRANTMSQQKCGILVHSQHVICIYNVFLCYPTHYFAKDYGLFCCCCCYCCLPLCIWSAGLNSHAKAQQSHLPLWSSSNKTSLIGNLLLYYFSIHPSVSECFFNIFHDVFVQIHQFFLQDAVTKSVFLFYLFLFLSYHHFWPFLSFRAEKENNVVNTNLSTVYLVL